MIKGIFLKKAWFAIFFLLIPLVDPFSQDFSDLSTYPYRLSTKKVEVDIRFHFEGRSFPLVQRMVRILEDEGAALFDYFSYRPSSPIHIVLDEKRTMNNGSASIFPDNVVTLITFPPLGSSFLLGEDDPVKNLVIHELAHIAHLDQVGGINRVISKVFGSTGKLMPSAVPRWFSEGVATWAETRFTQGGRQRLAGVRWQVERALLDPHFCSDLSCLDSPGSFPYGSSGYWIGADFLAWIEDRKEGSVACLVRENADNLAFFLGHAFRSCAGTGAAGLYDRYRRQRREDILRRQKALRENSFVKSSLRPLEINRDGPVDLERGSAIFEGKLYYLWHRLRRGERMGVYDLEKGAHQSRRTPFFVASILPPSGGLLPVAVRDDHLARRRRRIVDLKSQKTLLATNVGADYAFVLERGKILYLRWDRDRWMIGEHHRQKSEDRILHRLPPWVSIKRPRPFWKDGKPWLSFQVFDGSSATPYQLWAWRLGEEKPSVLVRRRDAFTCWGQCEGVHLIKDAGDSVELIGVNALDQVVSKKIWVDWGDQVVSLVWDQDHTVLFLRDDPERAWHLSQGCGSIVEELSREANEKSVATVSPPVQESVSDETPGDLASYSPWSYMLPSWWWLRLGGADENNRFPVTVETSLQDPKRIHSVGLSLEVPGGKRSVGFEGSYTRKLSDPREIHARLAYRSVPGGGEEGAPSQVGSFSLYRNVYFSGGVWTPSLSLVQQRDRDRFGARRFQKISLSQRLALYPAQGDDFFHWVSMELRLSRSWRRGHFSYTGVGGAWEIDLRPWDRLLARLRVGYDKLFKTTFQGEILYGGGAGAFHSFYGLNAQEAFGNEIVTARGYWDGELVRLYRSWGLLPFYMKEVRFLVGIDHIRTDIIPRELTSHWLGLRLKFDLFYRSPGSWDLLYIKPHWGRREPRIVSLLSFSF